jgi:hypothetical protein
MDKKTFNINTVINSPSSGVCLEEVLATAIESVQLDSQDVIDIITVVSKQYHQFQQYFCRKHQFLSQYPTPRFPGLHFGGFGMASLRDPHLGTYQGKDHPELFEQLFALIEFQVTYHDTVLTDSFKFVGVEGEYLTYSGRDKELAQIAGQVVLHHGVLELYLDHLSNANLFRILPTPTSEQVLREALHNGTLRLPGLTPVNSVTRKLMDHIRNHGWQDLQEGELVVRVDSPEQVYFMGPRMEEDGIHMQVKAIPVEITETEEGIQATPQMHLGMQVLDLMFLKRYKHQA